MPWKGYNYEDAIVLNQRAVREDILTSVHVDEYILEVRRNQKRGIRVRIFRHHSEMRATKDFVEKASSVLGARMSGDILIGKITPKGEIQILLQKKNLRAIFGDKAGDVKDVFIKEVLGIIRGVVIDKKLYLHV